MAKKKYEREYRCYGTCKRASQDSRIVEGIAVVFNSDSENMGFIEQIAEGAITEETIKKSDILATFDHDPQRGILGRSRYGKGSLQIWLESDGLHYRTEVPETALGDEVLQYLDRGDVFGSSFEFSIDPEDPEAQEWFYDDLIGISRRIIKRIARLHDVSIVLSPAYLATSAEHRANEMANTMEQLNALQTEWDALTKVNIESI